MINVSDISIFNTTLECFYKNEKSLLLTPDVKMQEFMSKSARIKYMRYVDVIAFARLK